MACYSGKCQPQYSPIIGHYLQLFLARYWRITVHFAMPPSDQYLSSTATWKLKDSKDKEMPLGKD